MDSDDVLAPFSSRARATPDRAIKPDITGPGVEIAAARATDGRIGTPVDAGHVRLSGTSMATPHIAGAAAILAGQHPAWRAGDSKPAPAGMFTVSPASLTVPAGGSAPATVVADTKVDGADDLYTGAVSAGGVRTPIAVHREVESYDITLNFIDTNGDLTPWYGYEFVDPDRQPGPGVVWYDQSGVINVDARDDKPLGFGVDEPNARSTVARVGVTGPCRRNRRLPAGSGSGSNRA